MTFSVSEAEKPLKIYFYPDGGGHLYRQRDGGGNGTAIYRVDYVDPSTEAAARKWWSAGR